MSSAAPFTTPQRVIVTLSPSHANALLAAARATGQRPSTLASGLLAAAIASATEKHPEPSPWRRR